MPGVESPRVRQTGKHRSPPDGHTMGSHSLATSPATRRLRRITVVGVVAAAVWAGIWVVHRAPHTPAVAPAVSATPADTASALHLAELYHPAKSTSADVDTPAATAFLASLRQAGVTLAPDREDTAIDLAREAAASHAGAADLAAAVHTLFPEFTTEQARLFVSGAATYFSQSLETQNAPSRIR